MRKQSPANWPRCKGCSGRDQRRLEARKALDLNTATKDQLLSLPGASAAEADRAIAGRPYREAGDVVTRRIMPKAEYDKIADRSHRQEMTVQAIGENWSVSFRSTRVGAP
jgi:hypothetical protein